MYNEQFVEEYSRLLQDRLAQRDHINSTDAIAVAIPFVIDAILLVALETAVLADTMNDIRELKEIEPS